MANLVLVDKHNKNHVPIEIFLVREYSKVAEVKTSNISSSQINELWPLLPGMAHNDMLDIHNGNTIEVDGILTSTIDWRIDSNQRFLDKLTGCGVRKTSLGWVISGRLPNWEARTKDMRMPHLTGGPNPTDNDDESNHFHFRIHLRKSSTFPHHEAASGA